MSDDEYIPPSVHSEDEDHAGPSSAGIARVRPLPRTTFRSIEFPGPMQRAEQILKLVHQEDIDDVFNAPMSDVRQLEMRYRPDVRAAVPVRGSRVASQKVLVKVTKRRRKGKEGKPEEGVFTAEVMGNIPQTVRFRCKSTRGRGGNGADDSNGGLPVHASGRYGRRAADAGARRPGL